MKKDKKAIKNDSGNEGIEAINNYVPSGLKSFFARLGKRGLSFAAFASALASGFMTASFVAVLDAQIKVENEAVGAVPFTDVRFVNNVNLGWFFFIFFVISAGLTVATLVMKDPFPSHVGLLVTSVLFAYLLAVIVGIQSSGSDGFPNVDMVFMLGIAMIMFIIMRYLSANDKLKLGKLSQTKLFSSWKLMYVLTAVAVAVFTVFITVSTYYRYLTFSSTTFDFGIFAQMFENMAKTGLPVTTVERGGLEELSHFAVHFSPSWYLLFPGYLLFRHPFYLYFINALVIALGAFPVFRICKKLGTTPLLAGAFVLIYLLFPSMSGSAFYDIHENSLLPVLLLYTVYFFLDNKTLPMFGFALLTLGDKEDAAIYIMAFALYIIFATKKKWTGVALFLLSVVYFVFATSMITALGGSVMTSRLSQYYPTSDSGFMGVIKTCLTDIGYLIRQVFLLDDSKSFGDGKLQFMLWMLLPVLFAPFLSKKNSLLFLLIPMMVINLMPSHQYQYDVYFQYTYGPAALIIFATIMAITAMKGDKRIRFASTALVLCFILSGALTIPKVSRYTGYYENSQTVYRQRQDTLDEFVENYYKDGDSVCARTSIMPHLYMIENLCEFPDSHGNDAGETDWYVIFKTTNEKYCPGFLKTDYSLVEQLSEGDIQIYKLNK